MTPGLVPLGFRKADVQAELRRRAAAHQGQLEAARLRLVQLQRQNAESRRQLALLEQEIEQLRIEQQRLLDSAGGVPVATPARPETDRQQEALEQLRQQVQAARRVRREIAAKVFTLISPFLSARPASPPATLSKEEPPNG